MQFSLDFPVASKRKLASGKYRVAPEDFFVEELMSPVLEGRGEHVWLKLEKTGQNTAYVAQQLARFAGVRDFDVGYSGLKDRHAKTQQWFSIYLGNRAEPNWEDLNINSVEVLALGKYKRKLRRGEHEGNRFIITVRELSDAEDLAAVLEDIKNNGFPNYFGVQRFGRDCANLSRGESYFKGEIKASKAQRGFYLSAARSYLFNLNVAKAVAEDRWQKEGEMAPLYGDSHRDSRPLNQVEQEISEQFPIFLDGIHRNRLKLEWRPIKIIPKDMSWSLEPDMLSIKFTLPTGVFATSVLRELGRFEESAHGNVR